MARKRWARRSRLTRLQCVCCARVTDAHIGFYAGQLHYYHVLYGELALAFVGVLAQSSGELHTHGPIAVPCISFLNNLNAPLSLLFLGSSMLPLFFVTWCVRAQRGRSGVVHGRRMTPCIVYKSRVTPLRCAVLT
jgi:hypothetical protein